MWVKLGKLKHIFIRVTVKEGTCDFSLKTTSLKPAIYKSDIVQKCRHVFCFLFVFLCLCANHHWSSCVLSSMALTKFGVHGRGFGQMCILYGFIRQQ